MERKWILVSEWNPTKDGQYEVTLLCYKHFKSDPQEYIHGFHWFTVEKAGRDKEICGWDIDSVVAWLPNTEPYTT